MMCGYCVESTALEIILELGRGELTPEEASVLHPHPMLSFHVPATVIPDAMVKKLYVDAEPIWRQTAAMLWLLYYNDKSALEWVEHVQLPTRGPAPSTVKPDAAGQALIDWYRSDGQTDFRHWRDICARNDELRQSALILLSGIFRHRALTDDELAICCDIAHHRPGAEESWQILGLWLRRQYRLLLWEKGYKNDIGRLDSYDAYQIILRVLDDQHGDEEAREFLATETEE